MIAIDAGNSRTAVAVVRDGTIRSLVHVSTDRLVASADPGKEITAAVAAAGGGEKVLDGSVLSSVVPSLTPRLAAFLRSSCAAAPLVVSPDLDLGITIGYARPDELGPDRIAGAVAGFAEEGGPVVVVDFGTATTFNAVTAAGVFVGGAIAPGLLTGADALAGRGARLFRTEIRFPERSVGRSTDESIRSGVLWGAVSMTDGMLAKIFAELGGGKGIATGGLARVIAPRCRLLDRWDEELTLKGLMRIYHRNR